MALTHTELKEWLREEIAHINENIRILHTQLGSHRADVLEDVHDMKNLLVSLTEKVTALNGGPHKSKVANAGGFAGFGALLAAIGYFLDWVLRRGGP